MTLYLHTPLLAAAEPLQNFSLLTESVRAQALLIREAGGACRVLPLPGAFVDWAFHT